MTDLPSIKGFRFVCETCGSKMPHDKLDVMKVDLSARHGGPEWTAVRNINYCTDSPRCLAGAKQVARQINDETERMVKDRSDQRQ